MIFHKKSHLKVDIENLLSDGFFLKILTTIF